MKTAEEYFNERDGEITDRAVYGLHHDSTIIKLMEEYAELYAQSAKADAWEECKLAIELSDENPIINPYKS